MVKKKDSKLQTNHYKLLCALGSYVDVVLKQKKIQSLNYTIYVHVHVHCIDTA